MLDGRTLKVAGERKMTTGIPNADFLAVERPFGKFNRTFRLNSALQTDKMTAGVVDGVLTISVPKEKHEHHVQDIPVH